jgi:hypothetical protein
VPDLARWRLLGDPTVGIVVLEPVMLDQNPLDLLVDPRWVVSHGEVLEPQEHVDVLAEAIEADHVTVLLAEVDRLQRQVAELQQANATLREALSHAQKRLITAMP